MRGRDLGSTVRQAIDEVGRKVKLPEGYHLDWTGEYESQQRANRGSRSSCPITLLLMAFILYSAFGSWKWVGLILAVVALSPLGGLLSLLAHRHAFHRVVRTRIPGADRRLGGNRRHHGRVHQPVADARHEPVREAAKEGAALACVPS